MSAASGTTPPTAGPPEAGEPAEASADVSGRSWSRGISVAAGSVAVGLVLLLALGLRLYRLDGQSLWYDEGVSAFMTTRDWSQIARAAAADIHPPLYYWLLAAWAVPFGRGELALRGFSVVCGVLAVWATWRLGRSLYGETVGLAAAAVLAVSPLAVQYGQEVRMYALASLLAAGVTWAYAALRHELLAETRHDRRRAFLAVLYGLLAAALLYTQYYGVLVLAAHQVHLGLTASMTRRWSTLPGWLLANGLAAMLYLPWLPHALRQTGYYPGLGTPQPAWTLLLDMVNVLSIGIATTRFGFRPGLAPFLVLAGAGLVARRPSPARGGPHPTQSDVGSTHVLPMLGGLPAPQHWGVGGAPGRFRTAPGATTSSSSRIRRARASATSSRARRWRRPSRRPRPTGPSRRCRSAGSSATSP